MLFRIFAIGCLSLVSLAANAASVIFLNPGFENEPFWSRYAQVMHEAAEDLGLELEVLYGQRDARTMKANLHSVLARSDKPDYLLFTNELGMGPETIRQMAGTGTQLLALHSTLTAEQQTMLGDPRTDHAHWLGSLVPNDEEAGYLMAKALLVEHRKGDELLAFSAPRTTPSTVFREAGLMRALAEHPEVRLRQLVNGEWSQQRAYEQARVLLPRYPNAHLVWSANDEMAFGALEAAKELGRSIRVTALNNAPRTFEAAIDGRFNVLVTGHFMLGACALVMLHDHAQGYDFADHGGLAQTASLLRVVNPLQAKHLMQHMQDERLGLDFRRFSQLGRGETCSIDPLLDS